jgi:hypothetical protein
MGVCAYAAHDNHTSMTTYGAQDELVSKL